MMLHPPVHGFVSLAARRRPRLSCALGRVLRAGPLVAIVAILLAGPAARGQEANPSEDAVRRLVQQLNDDRAAQREAAEEAILNLATDDAQQADQILAALPQESDRMPPEMRDRLGRIRRTIEDRAAKAAVSGTVFTLAAQDMPLAEAFAAIKQQTGNEITDRRQQFGGDVPDVRVSFEFDKEPFWSAMDQILDKANFGVYNYGGSNTLMVINREADDRSRHGAATYSGPFRFEVLNVQAQQNLRKPGRGLLNVQIEVSWEPRLQPIAFSQPMTAFTALDDAGNPLELSAQQPTLEVEIQGGIQATELIVPFVLPARSVGKIASLKGTLDATVPGRTVEFRFDNLDQPGQTQSAGGVHVTLDEVRKINDVIWDVRMRLRQDEDNDALASHRLWVSSNVNYLVGADGQPIDIAGLETTMQSQSEVGFAYQFELPAGRENLQGLSWVYKTPAAIVRLPVEYEIKDIPLP